MHTSPPAGAARDTQARGLRETERRELASLPPLSPPPPALRRPVTCSAPANRAPCCRGRTPLLLSERRSSGQCVREIRAAGETRDPELYTDLEEGVGPNTASGKKPTRRKGPGEGGGIRAP